MHKERAVILALYRLAWEPVFRIARAMGIVERIVAYATPATLWPAHWRLRERLSPAHAAAPDAPRTAGTYWLHAASLGECKGLWAFAQTLADETGREHDHSQQMPHYCDTGDTGDNSDTHETRIVLTANTTTGLDFLRREIARIPDTLRRSMFTARIAPLDHPRLARAFLAAHNVRTLVLFEVELWPHWIAAARRAGLPILWISARLTPRARRLYAGNALFAGALRRVLRDITWIQTQTEDEEHALRRLGAPSVETGGDLRGLHALGRAGDLPRPREEASRRGVAFVSIHARELPALVAALPEADTFPPQPLFIFPRKLSEVPVFRRLLAPHGFVLRSRHADAPRVIVDAYGLVEQTLAQVHTAVIGGSFGTDARIGGHNAWEPLLAGCRIVIGPHHHNQRALIERLESQGLMRVMPHDDENTSELREAISGAHADASGTAHTTHATDAERRRVFIDEESTRLKAAARRACIRIHESG